MMRTYLVLIANSCNSGCCIPQDSSKMIVFGNNLSSLLSGEEFLSLLSFFPLVCAPTIAQWSLDGRILRFLLRNWSLIGITQANITDRKIFMHKVFKWKVCQRENGKKTRTVCRDERKMWIKRDWSRSSNEGKTMKTMFRCIFNGSIEPINNRYKKWSFVSLNSICYSFGLIITKFDTKPTIWQEQIWLRWNHLMWL